MGIFPCYSLISFSMSIFGGQTEAKRDIISTMERKILLENNLNEIQKRLEITGKNSLNTGKGTKIVSQREGLQFQIENPEDHINGMEVGVSCLEVDSKNRQLLTECLSAKHVNDLRNNSPFTCPIFNRGKDSISYFLHKFEDRMNYQKIPKEEWETEILMCFEHEAYYYVKRQLPMIEEGWDQFTEILKRHFGEKSELEKCNDLLYFRMKKKESIDLCCDRFTMLAYEGGVSKNGILVASFLKGLDRPTRDKLLRSSLFEKCYPRLPLLNDVTELAIRLERRNWPTEENTAHQKENVDSKSSFICFRT